MKKYFDLFAACRLFDGFSPEELSEIAERLSPTERAFQKGEYIYRYGEPITTVGLLLAGRGIFSKRIIGAIAPFWPRFPQVSCSERRMPVLVNKS